MTLDVGQGDEVGSSDRRRLGIRLVLVAVVVVALLFLAVVAMQHLAGQDREDLFEDGSDGWAYVSVFLLIFADAVCPIFPGESTLNAASTLAAAGKLSLAPIMVAGAAGAVVGDSTLYWIARRGGARFRARLDKASANPKVKSTLDFMGSSAPLILVLGRYIPGLRFVINATLGAQRYPYRRFLVWSAIGGVIWSIYTCALAYAVSTTLEGFPLASIVISATITTVAICVVFLVARRSRRRAARATAGAAV